MEPNEPTIMAGAARRRLGSDAEELALLVDAVRDYAIFKLSPRGEIDSWNTGAERIFGYPADEVAGREFSLFYGPEDLAARKPERELETAARTGRIEDEGWRLRKDGTRFWANTVITALREETGELRGFAKVTRDMSARRAAEEKLRRSEEMFRLLVASVHDYAIFLLDPEGRVTTWNEGVRRIKGFEPQEIIGRHFSTFYTEEDKQNHKPEKILQTAREMGSVEDEGWRVRKDGTRFWANVVITAVHDEEGTLRGFAKVTRDITDRKRAERVQQALLEQREARLQAEEERRRAEMSYQAAQEANRAKDEFLMTLSHELRTPMTAILGWARLLPTLPPDHDSFREGVAAITRSAQHQARLIDDVLDVSRIVSGKLRLSVQDLDVTTLLQSVMDAIRPAATAKQITLGTAFEPALGTIVADPTRIQQILWNLVSNAVKFTPKHGLITISARRTSSHLQVSVRDTGEGIDPHFLPHVFEPFRQAEGSSTRVHGGLGLGLSIVRYLIEAHGGTVSAQSGGKGQGAEFTVTLPIGALKATSPESRSDPRHEQTRLDWLGRLTGLKILLIDDDPEALRLVVTVLRQAGAEVTAVDTARKALEELNKALPEMVVTDIAMPDTDGYWLAREIRNHPEWSGLLVVAFSAFPAGAVAAHDGGFDAYLTKPIDPAELVDEIAQVRARKR